MSQKRKLKAPDDSESKESAKRLCSFNPNITEKYPCIVKMKDDAEMCP